MVHVMGDLELDPTTMSCDDGLDDAAEQPWSRLHIVVALSFTGLGRGLRLG